MARMMDCSIFVKNGPHFNGLGFGGEGPTSFTIASPTVEGMTTARSFTRKRQNLRLRSSLFNMGHPTDEPR